MPESIPYDRPLVISEGWLCLDFVNVVGWLLKHGYQGKPFCYAQLLGWAKRTQAISMHEFDVLQSQAESLPQSAEGVVQVASSLCLMLDELIESRYSYPLDETILHQVWSEAAPFAHLAHQNDQFVWRWTKTKLLSRPLWPVAWSACGLLVSHDLQRVGRCASDDCNWWFLDASKNLSRRWCSMKTCGNAAKARRHYHKHKRAK